MDPNLDDDGEGTQRAGQVRARRARTPLQTMKEKGDLTQKRGDREARERESLDLLEDIANTEQR